MKTVTSVSSFVFGALLTVVPAFGAHAAQQTQADVRVTAEPAPTQWGWRSGRTPRVPTAAIYKMGLRQQGAEAPAQRHTVAAGGRRDHASEVQGYKAGLTWAASPDIAVRPPLAAGSYVMTKPWAR